MWGWLIQKWRAGRKEGSSPELTGDFKSNGRPEQARADLPMGWFRNWKLAARACLQRLDFKTFDPFEFGRVARD